MRKSENLSDKKLESIIFIFPNCGSVDWFCSRISSHLWPSVYDSSGGPPCWFTYCRDNWAIISVILPLRKKGTDWAKDERSQWYCVTDKLFWCFFSMFFCHHWLYLVIIESFAKNLSHISENHSIDCLFRSMRALFWRVQYTHSVFCQ